jgi:hypothetical protein
VLLVLLEKLVLLDLKDLVLVLYIILIGQLMQQEQQGIFKQVVKQL